MSSPPKAPPTDAERELADLVQIGRRLAENLQGLQKHAAHLKSEIERHEVELVAADARVANLPNDARATAVHDAKTAQIAVEMNRNRLLEQLADLRPELHELPKLIEANREAVAGAQAELR
jgi:predicted  nucleic acid-binding Zn-ribbon protein